MDRYTRKDAENAFKRLVASINGRVAESYNDVGAYQLDYASAYGGFTIHKIITQTGGVSCPFGYERYSAREFCEMVRFTQCALDEHRDN